MRRTSVITLLIGSLSLFAGCRRGPTGVDATCIAAVNVHGVLYVPTSIPSLDSTKVETDVYLTVTRDTGCLDQGEPGASLADGESNFLPVGTTLHRITDTPPEWRLAYWEPEVHVWRALEPPPRPIGAPQP